MISPGLRKISNRLAKAGVLHSIVHSAVFKPNWTATEVKLFNILKTLDEKEGIPLEELRQKLAGKAWEDLKKIPKPVDQAIDSLVSGAYAMKVRRNGVWHVLKDQPRTEAKAGTYSPSPVSAEIRRIRDNKIFRTVVEVDSMPILKFSQHLAQVCEEVEKLLGDECYVYWHGVKYVPKNGVLKGAGTAIRNFQNKLAYAKTATALESKHDVRYGKYPPIDYKKASQTVLEELTKAENAKHRLLGVVSNSSKIIGKLYKKLKNGNVIENAEICSELENALDRMLAVLEDARSGRMISKASVAEALVHDSKNSIPDMVKHANKAFDLLADLRVWLGSRQLDSGSVRSKDILKRIDPVISELQLAIY